MDQLREIMTSRKILYLSQDDVASIALDLASMIKLLEKAFIEKGEGRVEMPPKPGIHTQPNAFIHAMPAYIPELKSAGIKWVSGYPENLQYNLPYINGLLILNDVQTGIPYVIMDCTWITAYRTAAATALSARYQAQANSCCVGIIACGMQGRSNLEALCTLFPIQRVYVYDIRPEVQLNYIQDMSEKLKLEIIGVDQPRKAVVDADIIVTSGPILKKPSPTIEKDWVKPGAFASAVDFDSYWKPDALHQFDKISTDDLEQFFYYKNEGYFQHTPHPYADLGEIVTGKKTGRDNTQERCLAINLGLALDDMAVAPEIYRRAIDLKKGTWLPL